MDGWINDVEKRQKHETRNSLSRSKPYPFFFFFFNFKDGHFSQ